MTLKAVCYLLTIETESNMYGSSSESNGSYFIMLSHDSSDRCSWNDLPANILLHFVIMQQVAAEAKSGKMAFDMEVLMKQRYLKQRSIKLLHMEKIAPIHVHQCLLNICQTVDVKTVRLWVVHFSNYDSNSGSSLLVQIFMGATCRLLPTDGKNGQLMVMTMLKRSVL